MNKPPPWLPSMVSVDGVWEEVVACLYQIFETDFKHGKPTFEEYPVWWDWRILPGDSYEEGFWHLITRTDFAMQERIPDFQRAKRLPWCAPTIRNSADTTVSVWDYEEASGRIRTYLWLEDLDYVVILEKRKIKKGKIAFLITAFHLDRRSRRNAMRRKYERRCH